MKRTMRIAISGMLFVVSINLLAQESATTTVQEKHSAQELADKLSNPVANMISVPFQENIDWGIGKENGSKSTLNIQPVIPISITPKWNLITRYIIPLVTQHDITGHGTDETGLSDATVSAWVTPTHSKIIWGVGPAFLVPIATIDFLGTKKFGIGPTALLVKQSHGWTVGALANQLFSVAGDADRPDLNQLFVQPFFAYNFKSGAGLGGNAEMTFNWEANTTTIILNPIATAISKFDKQTFSMGIGPRIPLAAPEQSKPAMGIRAVLTLVFPK